ncbi:MAG: hypothetical protein FVQ85_17515 [Planctomycetes bacterium]|nr:hypothetical protein [Planctomycetota bacterium]
MQIDGVNAGNGLALGLTKVRAKNQDDQGVPEPTNITGENTPAVQTTDSTTETSEEIPGVIQNLMDGHYKGVADVRLRINFNEEIEAIEAAQRQAIADEQLALILESITGTVDDEPPLESATALVAESQDQTDEPAVTDLVGVAELQVALADDFNAITESYAGTSTSSDQLAEDLWSAFNDFVGSMLELYPPPEEEAPTEDPEPVPPPAIPLESEPTIATATLPEYEYVPTTALEMELKTATYAESEPVPPPVPPLESESELSTATYVEPEPVPPPAPPLEPELTTATLPEYEYVPPTTLEMELKTATFIESEPVPPPTEPEPEPEPTPDIQDYLVELEASFSTAIDELMETLSTVSILPDLSEPSGDGSAYEKFLAIYNEMQNDGGAGTVDAIG